MLTEVYEWKGAERHAPVRRGALAHKACRCQLREAMLQSDRALAGKITRWPKHSLFFKSSMTRVRRKGQFKLPLFSELIYVY